MLTTLTIIIGPSCSTSYLLRNKVRGGRRESGILMLINSPPLTPAPSPGRRLFLGSRDGVRTDNNPRLKGGRICLNRSKNNLTVKLPRNSRLFPRAGPAHHRCGQTDVAGFGREAVAGLPGGTGG